MMKKSNLRRDKVFLDGISVDAVVDLYQIAFDIPAKLLVFSLFEPLELHDEVDFEFGADPHAELKCDIFVGIGAAVSPRSCFDPDGIGFFNPLLHTDLVAIQTSLAFNCGEFAIIKIRIVNSLPDAKELDSISVTQPIRDEEIAVFGLQHIRQRDIIHLFHREDSNLGSDHFYFFSHMQPLSTSYPINKKSRSNRFIPGLAAFITVSLFHPVSSSYHKKYLTLLRQLPTVNESHRETLNKKPQE